MELGFDISLLGVAGKNGILCLDKGISQIIDVFLLKLNGTDPVDYRNIVIAFQDFDFFLCILESLGQSKTDICIFLPQLVMELVYFLLKILRFHILVLFPELRITFCGVSGKSNISFLFFLLDVNLSLSIFLDQRTSGTVSAPLYPSFPCFKVRSLLSFVPWAFFIRMTTKPI